MPEGRTPIGRDIVHTLRLVRELQEKHGRDGVPGTILLRAARSAWLIGDEDAAREHYRRAATRLLDEARTIGRTSFTYCALAEVALGAAYMARDRQVLRDVCVEVITRAEAADPPARYAATSRTREEDLLLRVVFALAKVRAHWYQGQYSALKTPPDQVGKDELFRRTGETEGWIPRLIRNATALEGAARDLWLTSRGPRTVAALKAAGEAAQKDLEVALLFPVGGGIETASAELRGLLGPLDSGLLRWLLSNAAQPPTVMDVVDEELISIVGHATRLKMRLPPQLMQAIPLQPGQLAKHVA